MRLGLTSSRYRQCMESSRSGRISILHCAPTGFDPRWQAKATVNEVVPFTATVVREGHDAVGALLQATRPDGTTLTRRMRPGRPGTDRFVACVRMDAAGMWRWRVLGFDDEVATWRHDAPLKIDAGVDVAVMYELGARLLDRAPGAAPALRTLATGLRDASLPAARRRALLDDPAWNRFEDAPLYTLHTVSDEQELRVESTRAGVGSWYEFFPRSEGARQNARGAWTSGTFQTATARLDDVAAMGFDVLYLPPIHPIGQTNRKGRNNTLHPGPDDPGSPWAIGGLRADGTPGGHTDVHPDLGTMVDFRKFVAEAQRRGIAVALDLALQASPDHPWVTEHPEWFTTLPDGTIRYAENPPKKYQDIYPLNFDQDPEGIFAEVVRIVRFWMATGVRIFRVDNPHTKPFWLWERLIATITDTDPDVVFLAEAFTRPAIMYTLAAIGFQQSYTYFTWRNTKPELESFLTDISTTTADFFRPNLFVNTPDILTEYLQQGGPAAFAVRATIAATAAPTWGVYAGFELFEHEPRPGSEEANNNEKYEYRPRDFAGAIAEGRSLATYLGILNRIRREHPALQQLRNLHLHAADHPDVLVFSKHLAGEFTPDGRDDTVIVVVNLNPHTARDTVLRLDLDALGISVGHGFTVDDLIDGTSETWLATTPVHLDTPAKPALIRHVRRGARV